MTISFIEQRPSGYYLRYTIPRHQRHLLNYRQLQYSLHNPSKRLAIKLARTVVSRIEVLLAATQRRREVLDDKTIRDTIRRYVLEEQSFLLDWHLTNRSRDDDEQFIHVDETLENIRSLRACLATSQFAGDKRFPATPFTQSIELEVCKLFKLDPATTDTTSLEFKKAYRDLTVKQMLKLNIPDSEKLQGRTVGELIAALKTLFDWLEVKRLIEV